MFLDTVKKYHIETASPTFTSIEQVHNVNFTGDKDKDEEIVDAIFEFIADESTSMTDKIAAAKFLAPTFGEDPETINEEFINEMLSETAAPKWFGAKQLDASQIINPDKLDKALMKANNKTKDITAKFYAAQLKIAKNILDKISSMSKSKVRIISKTRKNGYLFIVFSVDKVLDFPYTKDRTGVRITKHGSKEYHLFVGDLDVN